MSASTKQWTRPIVVIGAGIIGLSTAIRLLESAPIRRRRIPIHVVADHLPSDPLDPMYASTIAGAHHLSFADDGDHRQRRWDLSTLRIMMEEWQRDGEKTGLMMIKQTEYYVGETKHLKIYEDHPNFVVNDVNRLDVPFKPDHSISFTSLTMTPSTYLARLVKRIEVLGGRIHRARINSLDDLASPLLLAMLGTTPRSVVVCAGLGARTLGGVEDSLVYPTRGQVIRVKASWVREGFTRQVGSLDGAEGGERTYVIPRSNGEVIIGGTREVDSWAPYADEATKKDIARRAVEICPSLPPAHSKALGDVQSIVIDHLVGFRPSRRGGVRLEMGQSIQLAGENVSVAYNYGHGGAGWQSCWGCAEDVTGLIAEGLNGDLARL